MLNYFYKIFRSNPDFLRRLIYFIPIEKRLGGAIFKNQLNLIERTEKWPKTKLIDFQEKALWEVLQHATKNVPFYKDIRLDYSQSASRNLLNFPIIDKETIQENFDKFVAENIPRYKTYYVTTGGTSGRPLGFFLDNHTYGKEWAFIISSWKRVGYKLGSKIVAFRGVEFRDIKKNKTWQINPIYNALELSPFHMSKNNLGIYIDLIKKWNPTFVHGYPSAITILAKYVEENNVKDFPMLKAILAGSETIYPGQADFMEKALKTKFFSWYGQSEKVMLAAECEYSRVYHIFPQYGYPEVIGKDGEPIPWENGGEQGELIGTSFMNFTMPFIRYKTGDFATVAGWGCKDCGREYPLIKDIKGRWLQEMLIGMNGAPISMTALNMHSNVFKNVYRFQFCQTKVGKAVLRLQCTDNFNKIDERNILNELQKKVGNELDIELEFKEEINLSPRGKSLWLVQELEIEKYW